MTLVARSQHERDGREPHGVVRLDAMPRMFVQRFRETHDVRVREQRLERRHTADVIPRRRLRSPPTP